MANAQILIFIGNKNKVKNNKIFALSDKFIHYNCLLFKHRKGPLVREAQRHLAQWQLQPIAALLAKEASEKLAAPVTIDTMRPFQAFDAGGRARAAAGIIQALAMAKEAGVNPDQAMRLVNWE